MTETDAAPLVDRLQALVAQVETIVCESEDRAKYRREHGRALSAAHVEVLQALQGRLQGLVDRVAALVAPPADVAALKAQFEALRARLEGMEEPS